LYISLVVRGLKTINNDIIHLTRENNERKSFMTRKKYIRFDHAREFSIKNLFSCVIDLLSTVVEDNMTLCNALYYNGKIAGHLSTTA